MRCKYMYVCMLVLVVWAALKKKQANKEFNESKSTFVTHLCVCVCIIYCGNYSSSSNENGNSIMCAWCECMYVHVRAWIEDKHKSKSRFKSENNIENIIIKTIILLFFCFICYYDCLTHARNRWALACVKRIWVWL